MHSLYLLPDEVITVVFCGMMLLVFFGATRLVRRVRMFQLSKEDVDFVVRTQATLFSVCSLVLAFSLVQVQANFRRAEVQVSLEASQVNNLDRLLSRAQDIGTDDLRRLLLEYAKSIVSLEWPAMAEGKPVAHGSKAFGALSRGVMALNVQPGRQTSVFEEMMKTLETLAESRESRIDMAHMALPRIFWIAVTVTILLSISISATLATTPVRSWVMGSQSLVLGLLVSIVYIHDQPFKGETSVGPDTFVKAISSMQIRKE